MCHCKSDEWLEIYPLFYCRYESPASAHKPSCMQAVWTSTKRTGLLQTAAFQWQHNWVTSLSPQQHRGTPQLCSQRSLVAIASQTTPSDICGAGFTLGSIRYIWAGDAADGNTLQVTASAQAPRAIRAPRGISICVLGSAFKATHHCRQHWAASGACAPACCSAPVSVDERTWEQSSCPPGWVLSVP